MRPAGETGISSIGSVEVFVALHSSLIVGNIFVCVGGRGGLGGDWKYFPPIGLDGRSL